MDIELRGSHSFQNYKFQILEPNCGTAVHPPSYITHLKSHSFQPMLVEEETCYAKKVAAGFHQLILTKTSTLDLVWHLNWCVMLTP